MKKNSNNKKEPKYTPMMEQYLEIKKDYLDTIVFFRLGDFYEMFFDDAILCSKELEIALTGKDAGQEERVPMCGIPYHAVEPYLEKLIQKNYKVAIVEQVENKQNEDSKIVKREVVRLVTPGTIIEGNNLGKDNNYLVAIIDNKTDYSLSFCDLSTGEINVTTISKDDSELISELLVLKTREIVVFDDFNKKILSTLKKNYQIVVSYSKEYELSPIFSYIVDDLNQIEYKNVCGLLINYLIKTQKRALSHLKKANIYNERQYLKIDYYSKKNLEIIQTVRNNQKYGSFFWLLDKCETAMGSRMMKRWIDYPLLNKDEIIKRYDLVDKLNDNFIIKEEIKNSFKSVYDLERIVGRISYGNCNAKDLVQLKRSLKNLPLLKDNLKKLDTKLSIELSSFNELNELYELLDKAICEDPPLSIKEGGIINSGFNKTLDDLKNASQNGKKWLLDIEKNEKEKTGIKNLKIGYNRVFGYYIEISKGNLDLVKPEFGYERKQTIANSERFITKELKDVEDMILNSLDKSIKLEYEIFCSIREETLKYVNDLQKISDVISVVDCLISFSIISLENRYVRPNINDNNEITIISARHPVIEKIQEGIFIENDIYLNKNYNLLLITGPNMSGKSTYMRQLALIIIMAQIGCFVPAESANLYIFDQIFTRIGAADDLISGQSTFMVEMLEANYALKHATTRSLILFDEIGRGTATYDGMAIAQSIIEYIHEKIGCASLFSTHYHELINLENSLNRLKNIHVTAKEGNNGIVFLHKIKEGPSDKSFGINVAELAKLPKSLIRRSKELLDLYESNNKIEIKSDLFNFDNYEMFEEEKNEVTNPIIEELNNLDLENITAKQALDILYDLKNKL